MRKQNAGSIGALLGCLLYLFYITLFLAFWAAVIYVAWHFISKFW